MSNTTEKSKLLGEVLELEHRNVRVLEGQVRFGGTDYKVVHDIEGLCAFVGRVDDEKGWVLDSFPVFYPEGQNAVRVGIVLLCDLLRDFTVENRIAHNKYVIGNIDNLEQHVLTTYGKTTFEYVNKVYLNRKIGGDTAKFLAKRLARYLRTNYPGLGSQLEVNGRRLAFRSPHKTVLTIDDTKNFASLAHMANYLGSRFLDAKQAIAAHDPKLLDQSNFFQVTD